MGDTEEAKPDVKQRFHLVVVGERQDQVLSFDTPGELSDAYVERQGNIEIVSMHLFHGVHLKAQVIRTADLELRSLDNEPFKVPKAKA
jgi:hypothetical protein